MLAPQPSTEDSEIEPSNIAATDAKLRLITIPLPVHTGPTTSYVTSRFNEPPKALGAARECVSNDSL